MLVKEFGVSGKTVEAALLQLQKEGLLKSQGPGRRRRIVASENIPTPSLRIAILTFTPLALTEGYLVEMQHLLNNAGHSAFFTAKSLAAHQFCANMLFRVPEDVSLISNDDDPQFAWFTPAVSHIRWDRKPVMRRIERWAANVSRGKDDRRQVFTKAEFIEGGTIGPANRGG